MDGPSSQSQPGNVRSTNRPTRNTVPPYPHHPLEEFRLPVEGQQSRGARSRARALLRILREDMGFVTPRRSPSNVSCPFPQHKRDGLAHTMFEYAQDSQTSFYSCCVKPRRQLCPGHHRSLLTKEEVEVWSNLHLAQHRSTAWWTYALARYDGASHYTDNKEGTATFHGAPDDIHGSVLSAIAYAAGRIDNLQGAGE